MYQSESVNVKDAFNNQIKELELKIQDLKLDNLAIQQKYTQYQSISEENHQNGLTH